MSAAVLEIASDEEKSPGGFFLKKKPPGTRSTDRIPRALLASDERRLNPMAVVSVRAMSA
jgi:hypothetical protein